ncbi:hypothetical protein NYA28ABAC_00075 [Salinicola sp. NYA28a]|jgi:hypothetical protein
MESYRHANASLEGATNTQENVISQSVRERSTEEHCSLPWILAVLLASMQIAWRLPLYLCLAPCLSAGIR